LSGTFDSEALFTSPGFTGHLTLALPLPPPNSNWGAGVVNGLGLALGSPTIGSFVLSGASLSDIVSLTFAGDLPAYTGGPFSGTWREVLETCVGFDCEEAPVTFSVSGTASVTPIPATLPLFATGLGTLGLLGWRRKRKATATA
jgi:hypothetical protein